MQSRRNSSSIANSYKRDYLSCDAQMADKKLKSTFTFNARMPHSVQDLDVPVNSPCLEIVDNKDQHTNRKAGRVSNSAKHSRSEAENAAEACDLLVRNRNNTHRDRPDGSDFTKAIEEFPPYQTLAGGESTGVRHMARCSCHYRRSQLESRSNRERTSNPSESAMTETLLVSANPAREQYHSNARQKPSCDYGIASWNGLASSHDLEEDIERKESHIIDTSNLNVLTPDTRTTGSDL